MMLENVRPRVFFEVGLGSDLTGRIVIELFNDVCPKLVESFRKLCGDTTKRDEPFYSGSQVTKIVKDVFIQITAPEKSVDSDLVSKEGCQIKENGLNHDKPFLVSVTKSKNLTQFIVTSNPAAELDDSHVPIGQLIMGQEIIKSMGKLRVDDDDRPFHKAKITRCGELVLRKKVGSESGSPSDSDTGSSASEDYSRRRRRKKSKKDDKSESRSKREKRAESGEIVDNESGKEPSPVGRPHPLANKLTSILPEEIPSDGRSNFLMDRNRRTGGRSVRSSNNSDRYDSKGNKIKGRGFFRFNRERSSTPPHWKIDRRPRRNNYQDREQWERGKTVPTNEEKVGEKRKRPQTLDEKAQSFINKIKNEGRQNATDLQGDIDDPDVLDYEENTDQEDQDPRDRRHQQKRKSRAFREDEPAGDVENINRDSSRNPRSHNNGREQRNGSHHRRGEDRGVSDRSRERSRRYRRSESPAKKRKESSKGGHEKDGASDKRSPQKHRAADYPKGRRDEPEDPGRDKNRAKQRDSKSPQGDKMRRRDSRSSSPVEKREDPTDSGRQRTERHRKDTEGSTADKRKKRSVTPEKKKSAASRDHQSASKSPPPKKVFREEPEDSHRPRTRSKSPNRRRVTSKHPSKSPSPVERSRKNSNKDKRESSPRKSSRSDNNRNPDKENPRNAASSRNRPRSSSRSPRRPGRRPSPQRRRRHSRSSRSSSRGQRSKGRSTRRRRSESSSSSD